MRDTAPVTDRRLWMSALSVVVCLAAAVAVTVTAAPAQKGSKAAKPPSTTYTGVTATFRSDSLDGIRGDGLPYVGFPGTSTSTTEGAFFVSSGTYDDFRLKLNEERLGGTLRTLTLDFGTQVTAPPTPCGGTKRQQFPCRKNFAEVTVTRMLLIDQGLLVRPANTDGSDLSGGMRAILIGQTVPAKLKLNFPVPDTGTLWWTLRYNTRDYSGSSYVYVTRNAVNVWTISAGGGVPSADNGVAELVASTDGSSALTHEGTYLMPFSITVVQSTGRP